MIFGRRVLLKWLGIGGAAVAGEIIAPAAELISLPQDTLIIPAATAYPFRYDCLLNDELMKLNDREFHEAFVGPGIMQLTNSFKYLPEQPQFINAGDVRVRQNQKRLRFPDGKVFLLERSFTPSYGHAASLYAMVTRQGATSQ